MSVEFSTVDTIQMSGHRASEVIAMLDWDEIYRNPRDAVHLASRCSAALEHDGNTSLVIRAKIAEGTGRAFGGEMSTSKSVLLEAVDLARSIGDDYGLCLALLRLNISLNALCEYAAGVNGLNEALAIAERLGDRELECQINNDLANAYCDAGNLEMALETMMRAIEGARACGNTSTEIYALCNLALILRLLDREDHAECWLNDALAVAKAHDRPSEAVPLVNLSSIYLNSNRIELAQDYAGEALDIAEEFGLIDLKAETLLLLSEIAFCIGDVQTAITHCREAKRLYSQAERHTALAHVLMSELRFTGQSAPLQSVHDQLLAVATNLDAQLDSETLAHVHGTLAEIHERLDRPQDAVAHLKRQMEFKETAWEGRSLHAAQRMAARLELQKALDDNERERQRSRELAESNARLAEANLRAECLLSEVRAQAALLERLSSEDPLTGLANRRRFAEAFRTEHERATRFGQPLTVALADLDYFKQINDQFGHAAGDAVLVEIAAMFQLSLRGVDVIARFGGEEFAILFPNTGLAEATEAMERVRLAIASFRVPNLHPGLVITMSAGIAELSGLASPDRLLSDADAALYAAKHAGRNRIVAHGMELAASNSDFIALPFN